MKRCLIIVLLIAHCALLLAQQSVLVGQVYDSETLQPLPNVTVLFQGTHIGTGTNEEGYFLLRAELTKKAILQFSCVGYKAQRFEILPGQSGGIDVAMVEKTTHLADLFVTPGANPALPLMERVRAARESNRQPIDTTLYDDYTSLFVSRIASRHLHRKLWSNLQSGMLMQPDSTYLLPLYLRQRHNGYTSSRATMLTDADYDLLLSGVAKPADFYTNTVSLYDRNFLSPLASNGNSAYNYFLADSLGLSADSAKVYEVHFRAKNPFALVFDGEMWIDSASAAVLRIDARAAKQASANYLRSLTVHQEFDANSHLLTYHNCQILMDMAVRMDTSHIFPTVLLTQENHLRSYVEPFTLPLPEVETSLPTIEQTESKMDTLDQRPLMRTAKWLAKTILTAYIPTGTCIDFGNGAEIFDINTAEDLHLAIPLRTNEKLMKNVSLEAQVGYGFGDHACKGAGTVRVNIPAPRRNTLTFTYQDRYIYSDYDYFDRLKRENVSWCKDMNIGSRLTRGLYKDALRYNTLVRSREFIMESENDWTDNLETLIRFNIGRRGYGEPTHDYAAQPSYRFSSLSATFRVGFNERKVDLYFQRIHVYNNLPVLYFNAEMGSYQLDDMNTYNMYGKLRLLVRQQVRLGVMGRLDYQVEGGLVLGRVPYTMLKLFPGVESYGFNTERFSLMYNYTYGADRYLQAMAEWNGQGCLFNLIPGIRYLRLRELLVLKTCWGGLSERHSEVVPFPILESGDSRIRDVRIPYVEFGFGIGNILRIGNVYAIWRLTHRDDPVGLKWGIKFKLQLES